MKKVFCVALMVIICFCFSACECNHDFKEATCTTPETCEKCGVTSGVAREHDYENGKCIYCSSFIPIEELGFTNTFGYNTWIRVRSYETDSTGNDLKSVELFAQNYSVDGLGLRVFGFRLNETYLEDILIAPKNNSPIHTDEERLFIKKANEQITLNKCVNRNLIGCPVVAIFERQMFNGKVVVEIGGEDNLDGYYVPLDIINFDTAKEVERIEKHGVIYSKIYNVEVK